MSKIEKEVIVPSDPVSREKIKKMLTEIGNEWLIIDGHKAVVKETIDAVAEEFDLPKKFVRKLAKTMYLSNFTEQENEFADFQELYEKVVASPNQPVRKNEVSGDDDGEDGYIQGASDESGYDNVDDDLNPVPRMSSTGNSDGE